MKPDDYRRLLVLARKRSRRADEAEDLLHDSLLAAARAGRTDFESEADRRWIAGVIRNQAALAGRTAVRRTRRERAAKAPDRAPGHDSAPGDVLPKMPRSARSVAALVLHGLGREEIAQALGLSDAALRQRIVAVRRALAAVSAEHRQEAMALSYIRRAEHGALELGLIRRSLLGLLRRRGGIGTHDPDGHLIVIAPKDLTNGGPAATTQ